MDIGTEVTMLFVVYLCCGNTLGNTVTLSPSNAAGTKNGELELVCQLTRSPTANPLTVNWFLNNNTVSMKRFTSDCTEAVTGSGYNQDLYKFTCSMDTFKMKILKLLISYNKDCWSCSVAFTNATETAKASSACITVTDPQEGNLRTAAKVGIWWVVIGVVQVAVGICLIIKLCWKKRCDLRKAAEDGTWCVVTGGVELAVGIYLIVDNGLDKNDDFSTGAIVATVIACVAFVAGNVAVFCLIVKSCWNKSHDLSTGAIVAIACVALVAGNVAVICRMMIMSCWNKSHDGKRHNSENKGNSADDTGTNTRHQ